MKKFFVIAAAALVALAACTKAEINDTDYQKSKEINFVTVANKATKAPITGTTYPSDAPSFGVFAWYLASGNWNTSAANSSAVSYMNVYDKLSAEANVGRTGLRDAADQSGRIGGSPFNYIKISSHLFNTFQNALALIELAVEFFQTAAHRAQSAGNILGRLQSLYAFVDGIDINDQSQIEFVNARQLVFIHLNGIEETGITPAGMADALHQLVDDVAGAVAGLHNGQIAFGQTLFLNSLQIALDLR